jgi:hypothetical protein
MISLQCITPMSFSWINGFSRINGVQKKFKTDLWQENMYAEASCQRMVGICWHFLPKTVMNNSFWQYWRLPPMDFHKEMISTKIKETNLWQENMCGVTNRSLSPNIDEIQQIFVVENRYERSFSTLPKVNIYGIFTEKWYSLKIHEMDLWQEKCVGNESEHLTEYRFAHDWHFWPKTAMDNCFRQ